MNKTKQINKTCHYLQFTLSNHNLKFSLHKVIKYLLSHLCIIKFYTKHWCSFYKGGNNASNSSAER